MKFSYNTHYFPPAPMMEIRLARLDESFQIGPLTALVDTGADASLIPMQYLTSLQLQPDNRKYLRSQWGEARLVDTYWVDIGIGDLRLPFIEVIADELGDEVIIGRNLLNKLNLQLAGPRRQLVVSE